MINDVQLNDILTGLEMTLRIDHSYRAIDEVVKYSIRNMENSYRISLANGIEDAVVNTVFENGGAGNLMNSITENLKSFALFLNVSMFRKQYGESLHDVNFLGCSQTSLLTALKCLQDKTIYDKKESFMESLMTSTEYIDMGQIKRLLIVLFILDKIGVQEGVALIATYLYLGGM